MSVEIICGKCGKKIHTMAMLRSIKDVMSPYKAKCPLCGHQLSTAEFTVKTQEN